MTRENVIVNTSILYRLREEERKRRRELDLPYSPYWHTRRLRFTAIFSDFAYRSQMCVYVRTLQGRGGKKKREGGETHRRPFFSSATRTAASPFTFSTSIHIYTAIADLLESSIYRGTASAAASVQSALVCETYTLLRIKLS